MAMKKTTEKTMDKTVGEKTTMVEKMRHHPVIILLVFLLIIGAAIGGWQYWQQLQSKVYIEKSQVSAPVIGLAPLSAGIIDRVLVREGDTVKKNQIVAFVDGKPITAKIEGLVISVKNAPGAVTNTQDPVVKMIDPSELRVIGRIEENKGLSDLKPGQRVMFKADAFGEKEYDGVVESISPTSRDSDIVFSISDKREEKEYNVKIKYDIDLYPELKNGMSAEAWVYK